MYNIVILTTFLSHDLVVVLVHNFFYPNCRFCAKLASFMYGYDSYSESFYNVLFIVCD